MKVVIVLQLLLFFCLSLVGQEKLDGDRYCVSDNKIYDFNTGKKLKNKDALELIAPFPKAYNLYEKSMKQKKIAIISGLAFLGFTAYIAGSDDIKDGGFGDYNTTQTIIAAGFYSSSAVLLTSLVLFAYNRAKSLVEINAIIDKGDTSFNGKNGEDYNVLTLQIDPTRMGLSLRF